MSLQTTLDALRPGYDWASVCAELADLGIHTERALAFPSTALRSPAQLEAQALLLRHLSSTPLNCAHQIANETACSASAVRCGIAALDDLIGGFAPGRLFELSGTRGSGKTHVALVTALQHLRASEQASALWISIDSVFRPEWALSVLHALDHPDGGIDRKPAGPPSQATEDRHLTTLDRLTVVPVTSVPELMQAVSDARSTSLRHDGHRLRIVVIDAITSLFQSALNIGSARGHAGLVSSIQHLAALARSPDLPFCLIIINSSVSAAPQAPAASFSGTPYKPALGTTMPYLTDLTLWLSGPDRLPKTAAAQPRLGDRAGSVRTVEIWRGRHGATAQSWAAFASDGLACWDLR